MLRETDIFLGVSCELLKNESYLMSSFLWDCLKKNCNIQNKLGYVFATTCLPVLLYPRLSDNPLVSTTFSLTTFANYQKCAFLKKCYLQIICLKIMYVCMYKPDLALNNSIKNNQTKTNQHKITLNFF